MIIPNKNQISIFSRVKNTYFEGANSVQKLSTVLNSFIGFGTYVSSNCKLFNCKIGKYCSIASKVEVVFGKHPTSKFVSTSPTFYSLSTRNKLSFVDKNIFDEFDYIDPEKKYYVEIGNDVWLGYGCIIMAGIKIGDGAVIASHAVVTKNVEPYSIVGGVPAKVIKYRFSKVQIDFLLSIKWWDRDINWLKEHSKYFDDIESLRNAVEK